MDTRPEDRAVAPSPCPLPLGERAGVRGSTGPGSISIQDTAATLHIGTIMDSRITMESLFIVALLAVFNIGLIFGVPSFPLAFQADPVFAGEWWRLVTWPFVHASRYHVVLDATGFLSAFVMLHELTRVRRLATVVMASVGSLVIPLLLGSSIWQDGLCGLSGPAHGVMAAESESWRPLRWQLDPSVLRSYLSILVEEYEFISPDEAVAILEGAIPKRANCALFNLS